MIMMKTVAAVGVALIVALGAGWVWGASGRSTMRDALATAQLRDTLLEGRAAILDARLDIYNVNFGNASKHLEAARSSLRAGESKLKDLGRQEDATEVGKALARIDEAQRLTGQLSQNANAVAADAAAAIGRVLDRTPH
jgi:hypothetical protein